MLDIEAIIDIERVISEYTWSWSHNLDDKDALYQAEAVLEEISSVLDKRIKDSIYGD